MAETAVPSWTPPVWSLHGSAQVRSAWQVLDEMYRQNPWNARLAGARAAAEWSMGVSPTSPITNERKPPERDACQWESHKANMRSMGIGLEPTDTVTDTFRRQYATGAAKWLFWWTGLEPLPGWLMKATPADPAAS